MPHSYGAFFYTPCRETGLPWAIQIGTGIASFTSVKGILLCTHNPLLMKGLYGILRDEGHDVDIADHPARAVRMVLQGSYSAVVIDSKTFGLSAEDAVQIIKKVSPDSEVILTGCPEYAADALSIRIPEDLEEVRKLVHGIHGARNISPI